MHAIAVARHRTLLVSMFIGVALAGCATQPPVTPARPGVNLAGFPPAFREGYADGCNSAGDAVKRDERRYREDDQYRTGWQDGQSMCSRRNRKP